MKSADNSTFAKIEKKFLFPSVLCFLTTFIVICIEIRHPYFFLQDDNLVNALPYYVHNMRSLLDGAIPFFNFNQYLGIPTTVLYASFYPLNYIALAISNLLFGHVFATIDILAVVHLVISALGFYALMRYFKLEEISCCFGAIAWTFSAFVITTGNTWIQTVAYAAYLPLIILFSIKQIYKSDSKNNYILIALRVSALLVGNPQYFLYVATFDLLTVIPLYMLAYLKQKKEKTAVVGTIIDYSTGNPIKNPSSFLLCFVKNYFIVFMIALPVILSALHQSSISANKSSTLDYESYASNSMSIFYWVCGLLMPLKKYEVTAWFEPSYISYVGSLTLLFIVIAVVAIKKSEQRAYIFVFLMLVAVTILWSSNTFITQMVYQLPIYNRLRFPFRLLLFTSFFLAIVSTFGFSIFVQELKKFKLGQKGQLFLPVFLFFLHVLNMLLFYVIPPQTSFQKFLDAVPIVEPLKDKMKDGRIVSAGLDIILDGDKTPPSYSSSLIGYNYATLWGLNHLGGYDTLVTEKNLRAALGVMYRSDFNVAPGASLDIRSEVPLEYFRIWGVKWYVIDKKIPLVQTENLQRFYSDTRRTVLFDSMARPLVYWSDTLLDSGIKHFFRTNFVELRTERESDANVVINVLYNPSFKATIDGVTTPIVETGDSQMSLPVPKGFHTINVKYTDKYFTRGVMISVLFFFTAYLFRRLFLHKFYP